ncbi:MAG TPA: aminotransferase class I/II-fold pyridoxal phosphate-dependent enzyme, partial [Rhodospirillaceae bacterium]|nr:aminotransferase class I/II-fold pyridoxal phosphate-dependent enzyme [Rhodospirillaceae bacterium]
MLNRRLDLLIDYPFQRLAALLAGPPGAEPLSMALGEPQHPLPPMVAGIIADSAASFGKYPPLNGTPEFRAVAAAWASRRFALPAGLLDPERHLLPLGGSREGLFQLAQVVCPSGRTGKRRPVVLLPNPLYQVYAAAALMAGAEPVFVPATESDGFLPDFQSLPKAVLQRTVLAYLGNPANPQGAVASAEVLRPMIDLARRHGFVLAVDECYSEIYD